MTLASIPRKRALLILAPWFASIAQPPPDPEPTYLTIGPTTHIHIDANSIWSDDLGLPGIEDLAPLANFETSTGCTITNSSIAGQQWFQMAANVTDIVFNPADVNILMAGETRNTIFNGKTAAQCLAEIHDYVDAVNALSVPPDYLVLMSSFHSDGVPTAADENAAMLEVDTYVRDHLAEFGAASMCWYRDLSPFFQDGTSRAGFMSSTTTCMEDFPGPYVHPKGSARELLATRMVQALQKIPA